jgi:hypothetical protein
MRASLAQGRAGAMCAVACCLLVVGCFGEATIAYKGTVTAADVAGHSFDDQPNPDARKPVEGARVTLYVTDSSENCSQRRSREPQQPPADATSKLTSHVGAFEFSSITFTGTSFVDEHVMICVEHRDFESYQYRVVYQSTKDPRYGEKFLNIKLKHH